MAIANRLEAIASIGWWPSQVGRRPSEVVGGHAMDPTASRLEAIATIRLEAIATIRLGAIAIRLEAMAKQVGGHRK